MLAADRPFAPAGKDPLVLKINDKLNLKCILLPAGRFLQGSPFYQRRYQDEYPHEVVLTKPFLHVGDPRHSGDLRGRDGQEPVSQQGSTVPGRASAASRIFRNSVGSCRRETA